MSQTHCIECPASERNVLVKADLWLFIYDYVVITSQHVELCIASCISIYIVDLCEGIDYRVEVLSFMMVIITDNNEHEYVYKVKYMQII